MKIKTLEEMKNRDPYKTNYEKIMTALEDIPEAPFMDLTKKIDFKFTKTNETKESYLDRHKKRWEKITWSYLLKETKLSPDVLGRYIKILRKLGVIENKGYHLSEKYRFEPLKIWQKNTILNSHIDNIIPMPNNTLYLRNLSHNDFTKEELNRINELNELTQKINDFIVISTLITAGKRKINKLWMDFLKRNEFNGIEKFSLWSFLIREFVLSEILSSYHNNDNSNLLKNQQKNITIFLDIYQNAFNKIFNKYYPRKDWTSINNIIENFSKPLNKLIEKINDVLKGSIMFFSFQYPYPISPIELADEENINNTQAEEIINVIETLHEIHPAGKIMNAQNWIVEHSSPKNFSLKKFNKIYADFANEKIRDMKNNNTFFKDEKIFDNYKEDIQKLGISLDELYNIFENYATIFYMPPFQENL